VAVVTAERLQLLERMCAAEVAAENYQRAAALRDERVALLGGLSEEERGLQLALLELRTADTPASRRIAAATTLAAVGDASLARVLAPALHDADATVAEAVEAALWAVWGKSDVAEVDALMQRGMSALKAAPLAGEEALTDALEAFGQAAQKLPSFAEAHNKQATVLFILRRYRESLVVCRTVVRLEPCHFGALSGAAMCCVNVGDEPEAVQWFKQALAVNPRLDGARQYIDSWMRRRSE
jgi:tetratricopeptide (TPR) repeat protein